MSNILNHYIFEYTYHDFNFNEVKTLKTEVYAKTKQAGFQRLLESHGLYDNFSITNVKITEIND